MNKYTYSGFLGSNGTRTVGHIEALSSEEAVELLRAKNIYLTQVPTLDMIVTDTNIPEEAFDLGASNEVQKKDFQTKDKSKVWKSLAKKYYNKFKKLRKN